MCFVTACRLIGCQSITIAQCSEAESKIIEFCKHFERLYGTETCTPNMHLSCHLLTASETMDQSTYSGVSPLRGIMVSLDHITRTITTLVSGCHTCEAVC